MIVLIILEVVPMTYLNHYYVKNIPDRQIYILAYSVLLIIFDFTLIYAFRRINLSYQKENELELKRRAAELEAHYYEDIEKQQTRCRPWLGVKECANGCRAVRGEH